MPSHTQATPLLFGARPVGFRAAMASSPSASAMGKRETIPPQVSNPPRRVSGGSGAPRGVRGRGAPSLGLAACCALSWVRGAECAPREGW